MTTDNKQEQIAQGLLETELLALAEKYIDIYPEYEQSEHCPVSGCRINWMNSPKNAEFCHIHGEKLIRGTARLTKAQMLNEISLIAKFAIDKTEKVATDE